MKDLLKTIKDPEKTENLGQLDVITEDSVQVQPLPDGEGYQVSIRAFLFTFSTYNHECIWRFCFAIF